MGDYYILDGKTPKKVEMLEWARWFEKAREERIVAKTDVGNAYVSTVFLGSDHQWGDGPPLIFETLIFGGVHDQDMWRCSTWEEAEQQHADACELVRRSLQ